MHMERYTQWIIHVVQLHPLEFFGTANCPLRRSPVSSLSSLARPLAVTQHVHDLISFELQKDYRDGPTLTIAAVQGSSGNWEDGWQRSRQLYGPVWILWS